jgi:hypothetical protein
MDKQSLHVRLPTDLHAALGAEAQRLGISLNAVVITALRQWQENQEEKRNGSKQPHAQSLQGGAHHQ